jgi:lipopolysaccharide transport system ATP-binding protein
MTIALSIENLSKQYRLGIIGSKTLREDLQRWWASLRGNPDPLLQIGQEHLAERTGEFIWALRDINFQVEQGEVLGIIGQNGAGKSTLLKILSNLTAPTTGVAKIKGRVASLLEVGTGFNPELTGRDNVFLNGAILGMSKAEIQRKFDEIVDFAGVEKFIDTPVKRYSSGMKVRLAFAVAAHLEPEILLVDEVLAVGDAAFQRKCLGKMDDVSRREGRTVLFVSHNMIAVRRLCDRAIRLDAGRIVDDGDPVRLISDYLKESITSLTEQVWENIEDAPGNDMIRLRRVSVRPLNDLSSFPADIEMPLIVEFEYWNLMPDAHLSVGFSLYSDNMVEVFAVGSGREPTWRGRRFPVGLFRTSCQIPGGLLNALVYRIQFRAVKDAVVIFRYDDVLSFEIADKAELRGGWYGKWPGVVRPNLDWKTELVETS